MRTNMKIVTIATVLLTASLLAGCGDAAGKALDESEIYMSQFGEFEDDANQSDNGLNEEAGSTAALGKTIGGEEIFEGTEFDGKPKEVPEESVTEETDGTADEEKKDEEIQKPKKKPAVLKPQVQSQPVELPANSSAGSLLDPAMMAQNIENPTENTQASVSSGGSSDTGSGVTQTAGDGSDSNSNNSKSNNKANATFE